MVKADQPHPPIIPPAILLVLVVQGHGEHGEHVFLDFSDPDHERPEGTPRQAPQLRGRQAAQGSRG